MGADRGRQGPDESKIPVHSMPGKAAFVGRVIRILILASFERVFRNMQTRIGRTNGRKQGGLTLKNGRPEDALYSLSLISPSGWSFRDKGSVCGFRFVTYGERDFTLNFHHNFC